MEIWGSKEGDWTKFLNDFKGKFVFWVKEKDSLSQQVRYLSDNLRRASNTQIWAGQAACFSVLVPLGFSKAHQGW